MTLEIVKNRMRLPSFTPMSNLESVKEKDVPVLTSLPTKVEATLDFSFKQSSANFFSGNGALAGRARISVKSGFLLVRRVGKEKESTVRVLSLGDCQVEPCCSMANGVEKKGGHCGVAIVTKDTSRLVLKLRSKKQRNQWLHVIQAEIKSQESLVDPTKARKLTVGTQFGKGHFGSVFMLRSESKTLAIKTLDVASLENEGLYNIRERIILEKINLLKDSASRDNFDATSLPRLFASFFLKNSLFLISDANLAGTLLQLLRKKKTLSEDIAKFCIFELSKGIQALHSIDVAHRDLKPENIMLDHTGHIKIVDFGLSREFITIEAYQELRKESEKRKSRKIQQDQIPAAISGKRRYIKSYDVVGTAYYQAPEMLRGLGHDLSVDLWQIGCVFYELLYGAPFFNGKTSEEIENKVMSNSLISLPTKTSIEISEGAQDFIFALLIREPGDRLGCKTGAGDLISHPYFTDYRRTVPEDLQAYAATYAVEEQVKEENTTDMPFLDFLSVTSGLSQTASVAGTETDGSTTGSSDKELINRAHKASKKGLKGLVGACLPFSRRHIELNELRKVERKHHLERLGANYLYYNLETAAA